MYAINEDTIATTNVEPKRIILSIFFIVLAALLYGSADTVNQAVSQASTDSTSTYVNTLAIVLGVAGTIELIMSAISSPSVIEFTKDYKKFFFLIVALIIYVASIEYIGFIVATLIFLPVTIKAMGYASIIKALVISSGITLFVYLLFQVGFDILLPEASLFS